MSSYARANVRITNEKKQKENSHKGITWSEMGKQNTQAKEVYWQRLLVSVDHFHKLRRICYSSVFMLVRSTSLTLV